MKNKNLSFNSFIDINFVSENPMMFVRKEAGIYTKRPSKSGEHPKVKYNNKINKRNKIR
jgi:hypothetical protein